MILALLNSSASTVQITACAVNSRQILYYYNKGAQGEWVIMIAMSSYNIMKRMHTVKNAKKTKAQMNVGCESLLRV